MPWLVEPIPLATGVRSGSEADVRFQRRARPSSALSKGQMGKYGDGPNDKWHGETPKYSVPVANFAPSPRTTGSPEAPKEQWKNGKEEEGRVTQAIRSQPAEEEHDRKDPRQDKGSPVHSSGIKER